MIDVKTQIVTELKKTNSNVRYELAIESPTLPLISYKVVNNTKYLQGNVLGYSDYKVQVKVWALDVATINSYTQSIDDNLREIGLQRTYYNELAESEVIIAVMQYSGLLLENFTEEE